MEIREGVKSVSVEVMGMARVPNMIKYSGGGVELKKIADIDAGVSFGS
jgi:hypothetical protein